MTRLQGEQNRTPLVVGTVLAALLIGLGLWFLSRQNGTAAATGDTKTFNLTGQPFLGKADAPVKMVVFEDFKCPVCKGFETQTMPDIQQKYIATGKVQAYRINFPFLAENAHLTPDDSRLAAQAAECAYDQKGNDGYNSLATILFRAQGNETVVWADNDKLEELAGSVDGLDMDKFKTCLESGADKDRVEADKKQGLDAGVNATPSIFINGKLVSSPDVATVSKAIDDASAGK